MESSLRERAKVMADLTAKVSAVRGDETEVTVAECWVEETRSSMIQPSHVVPVEEFQAASVKIEHRPGILGLGSSLIKGIGYFGVERGWAILHSLASEIALCNVFSGEKLLFIARETKWWRPREYLLQLPLVEGKVIFEPLPNLLGSSWSWL